MPASPVAPDACAPGPLPGLRGLRVACAAQKTEEKKDAGVRQMLGMKGAGDEDDLWKIRVQLTKPVTWVPLIWGERRFSVEGQARALMRSTARAARTAACRATAMRFFGSLAAGSRCSAPLARARPHALKPSSTPAGVVCGAAASGNYVWNDPTDIAKLLTCCMMSGPFLTGYTQTINDYYDREIDAINEPYRPIPSGAPAAEWLSWRGLRLSWRGSRRRVGAAWRRGGSAAGLCTHSHHCTHKHAYTSSACQRMPAGKISEEQVVTQFLVLLAGGLGTAALLDVWAGHDKPILFGLAVFGSFISYIYRWGAVSRAVGGAEG